MSYSLDEMIAMFRQELNDQVEPYLWSDDEIKRYLEEAQDQFMYKTMYRTDVLTYPVKADTKDLKFQSYILKIRHAYDQDERKLYLVDYQDWLNENESRPWRTDKGYIRYLLTDYTSHKIRLYPIPEQDTSVTLEVYRVAKNPLSQTGVMEVSDRQAQRIVLLGAKAYAYGKQDVEVYDPNAELKYLAQFENACMDWHYRNKKAVRTPRNVRYGGI